jgi:hypothetical protein
VFPECWTMIAACAACANAIDNAPARILDNFMMSLSFLRSELSIINQCYPSVKSIVDSQKSLLAGGAGVAATTRAEP